MKIFYLRLCSVREILIEKNRVHERAILALSLLPPPWGGPLDYNKHFQPKGATQATFMSVVEWSEKLGTHLTMKHLGRKRDDKVGK